MERPTDYTERMSSSTIAQAARTGFSYLLRRWRSGRRMSQLDLALEAAVSARHISFLESGRAQPSREMVLKLANALQVPFREQNILLQAVGFASVFRETSLDAAEMANVRRALELILRAHEPFSALAMTRYWDAVMVNRPQAARLCRRVLSAPQLSKSIAERDPSSSTLFLFVRLLVRPFPKRYAVRWAESIA